MNSKLIENNYIIIPNFIDKTRAINLGKEFIEHCNNVNPGGDDFVPEANSVYNYLPVLELLCEKTPQVSSILEEPVIPTYSYSRVYYNQIELKKHTDRDSCEISLTLHLHGDVPWEIYIETPQMEEKSVILNPGDAMLYLGITAPHWRTPYPGQFYCQCFLHYVRSRGDKIYEYFDKAVSGDMESCDLFKNNSFPLKDKKKSYENKNLKPIIAKSTNTLEKYIHTFDNIVSEELCSLIYNEYSNSDDWEDSQIANKETPVNKNIRNCRSINLSASNVKEKNFEIRDKIDKLLFESVSNAVKMYSECHSDFAIDIDTGYQLLKYDTGGFYVQHIDSFKTEQRSVSCSLVINDNYDGGEFSFFGGDIIIKAKKGSAIMFPSNFMFPHEILPVTNGVRYSIITWLV